MLLAPSGILPEEIVERSGSAKCRALRAEIVSAKHRKTGLPSGLSLSNGRPVEISVAAVYDRRTGQRPVFHLIAMSLSSFLRQSSNESASPQMVFLKKPRLRAIVVQTPLNC